jgi:phosphatidylglycerophosphatase A
MKQHQKSSDGSPPPVVTSGGSITSSRRQRTPGDYLALAIATCGVGYLPIAPGTWGSAVGVGLFFLLRSLFLALLRPLAARRNLDWLHLGYGLVTLEFLGIGCVTLVGIWAASRTEHLSGKKDPGKVVIDEVAGQMIALTTLPLEIEPWWMIGLAFLLFRLFDIIKPYPCRRLESLPSGLGIMADDVLAGAYAGVVVAVVVVTRWFV